MKEAVRSPPSVLSLLEAEQMQFLWSLYVHSVLQPLTISVASIGLGISHSCAKIGHSALLWLLEC